eukprot:Seg9278.2 transcript_id=Seg9278.2/GoldUCD/mRNA.D3Y31 product="hypothetical protein" protein_id=Seg9278.2/GoldUCD/D3Y31
MKRSYTNVNKSHYGDFTFQTQDSLTMELSGKTGHDSQVFMIKENAQNNTLTTKELNHWQWRHFGTKQELDCLKNQYEQYHIVSWWLDIFDMHLKEVTSTTTLDQENRERNVIMQQQGFPVHFFFDKSYLLGRWKDNYSDIPSEEHLKYLPHVKKRLIPSKTGVKFRWHISHSDLQDKLLETSNISTDWVEEETDTNHNTNPTIPWDY